MKKALFWKLLERFGVQGIQFVLQIVLARLLSPEHYGVLSIMIVFTNIANVFVQRGFNTALIQNKDVTEEDYSSVFWVSLAIASGLYVLMFFAAPLIAEFYQMPDIVAPFRVITLMLIPGAINSVQVAKVTRSMDFRKIFYSGLGGILIAGAAGIALACMGAGLWALVAQSLLNVLVSCIVMLFTVKWRPRFICNVKRIRVLFSYGSKLLVSGLLDVFYQNIQSLVVGKKYSADTLGYYNRGQQFPQFAINAINDAVQSVLLPAMSAKQDDRQQVKTVMRNAIMLSSYVVFPMMAGLAAVSEALIQVVLTDKWLPAVPYMQIYCFTFAFHPVHSCNLQAINAMGRSDIFLKLEVIKKSIGITALIFSVFCFDSPVAIALTGAFTTLISCAINAYPNKKLIGYSYMEQVKDMVPSFICAIGMCVVVLLVGMLNLRPVVVLVLQVITGVTSYLGISMVVRPEPFNMVLSLIKGIFGKEKR